MCRRTKFLATSLWLLLFVFDSTIFAQGTMGTVPDPISSKDLAHYSERLALSDEQRQAVDLMHDEYREAFNILRETDIERLLNDGQEMRGGMGFMMDRKAIEKALKDHQSILDKTKSLDNRLFDQVQTVLTEEQMGKVMRVKKSRERARYRSGLSRMAQFINPASRIDLSEMITEFDLSQEEGEAIDPLLWQYETNLTRAARELHESSTQMTLDMINQLQELGFTEEAMSDPEKRQNMWESFRTVWGEVNKKLAEQAAEVSDLNRKTLRTIATVSSPDIAEPLTEKYYLRAYREALAGNGSTENALRIALEFDTLEDEQLETIAAMSEQFDGKLDSITEDLIDVIDERRRKQRMFDPDDELRQKLDSEMESLQDKRAKLNETTMNSLQAVLGPELAARLERRVAEADESVDGEVEQQVMVMSMGGGGGFNAVSVRRVGDENPDRPSVFRDPFIPNAISKRDVENYANRLKLSEESRSILRALHQDYLNAFDAIKSNEIQAVRDATKPERAFGGAVEDIAALGDTESIDEVYRLRKRAIAAIETLDQSFFDDVEVAVASGDEQTASIERVRHARKRDIYNRGTESGAMIGWQGGGRRRGGARSFRMLGGGGNAEANVDLTALIEELEIQSESPGKFDSELADYESAVTTAFKAMFDASMRMQLERNKMLAEAMETDESGNRRVRVGEQFRDRLQSVSEAVQKTRQTVVSLNRMTLKSLNEFISGTDADKLRRVYNHQAFPDVFDDPLSAEHALTKALELADLSNQQRSQLQQTMLEFRSSYDEFCNKMVKIESNSPSVGMPGSGSDWAGIGERMREMEKIRFEREELNNKTRSRLRALLNDDQVARIGGLEDPKDQEDDW